MNRHCICIADCGVFEQGEQYIYVPITKKQKIAGYRVWPLFDNAACRIFSKQEFNSTFTDKKLK